MCWVYCMGLDCWTILLGETSVSRWGGVPSVGTQTASVAERSLFTPRSVSDKETVKATSQINFQSSLTKGNRTGRRKIFLLFQKVYESLRKFVLTNTVTIDVTVFELVYNIQWNIERISCSDGKENTMYIINNYILNVHYIGWAVIFLFGRKDHFQICFIFTPS